MTPKPFEPGARITWVHYYPDSPPIQRAGTVWDRAPSTEGAVVVAWVIPDVPLLSDLYPAIAVGKSTRRSNPVHGYWLDGTTGGQYAGRGELYSSNYSASPLGQLAVIAARCAYQTRQTRQERGTAHVH
jgi:hypothetical protein